MTNMLIDERPIMFLPKLAKALGSCERAIVLQQIHWLGRQPNSGRDIDGEHWVYGTYEEWCRDYFSMWSPHTLAKHIRNLEKEGVLISAQLRAHDHDQTKFYRLNYEHESLQSMLPDVVASEVPITPDPVAPNLPHAVASIEPNAVDSLYRTETSSNTSSEKGMDHSPASLAPLWEKHLAELIPEHPRYAEWLTDSRLEATGQTRDDKPLYRLLVVHAKSVDWLKRQGQRGICKTLRTMFGEPVALDIVARHTP